MSGDARMHDVEPAQAPAKAPDAPGHVSPPAMPVSPPSPPLGGPDAILSLQRTAGNRATTHALQGPPPSVQALVGGAGRPLAPTLRDDMERRFGTNFGAVRIHVGADAELSATEVAAAAYTFGRHIVFGRDAFAPSTAFGRTVLAHELAHVVQQRRGGAPPPVTPESALERTASAAARSVVSGSDPVRVAGASGPGLARMTIAEAEKILAGPLPEWIKAPARAFVAKHRAIVDYVAPPQLELSKPVERLVEKTRQVEDVVLGPAAPAPKAAKSPQPPKSAIPAGAITPAQTFDESVKKALSGDDTQVPDEVDSGIWIEDPDLLDAINSAEDGEEALNEILRERERKRLAPLRHPVDPKAFKGVTYDSDPHLSSEGLKEGKPYKSGFYWIFPVIRQDSQTVVRYKLFNPQANRVEWVVGPAEMKTLFEEAPFPFGSPGYTIEEFMFDRGQMIYGNKKELPQYVSRSARGEVWGSNAAAYQDPRFYDQTLQNVGQLAAAGTKPPPVGRAVAAMSRRGLRYARGATAATMIGAADAAPILERGAAGATSFETRTASGQLVRSGGTPSTPTSRAAGAAAAETPIVESAPPAPAAAAEAAPAQASAPSTPRAPRTVGEKAQAVHQGIGSAFQSSGGAAEETIRRAGDPGLRVQGRSAALELHTVNRYVRRGSPTGKTVATMAEVPSRAGSRTPDFVVTYTDGTIERVECVTVTGAPRGRVAGATDLASASMKRPPTVASIEGAILSKAKSTAAKPSQLASPIPGMPHVPPRGAIVANVVNGGSRAMADAAVSRIPSTIGAHVQRIEVTFLERPGGPASPLVRTTATYVRDASGRFVPMTP